MPIVPEDKDWTWVLEAPCEECGFEASTFTREDVGDLIRANVGVWAQLAEAHGPTFAERPSDDRWSALEYACHVRDVYALYDYRLHLMLDHDDPDFPNWDQDASAVDERYNEQDLATVITDLDTAGQQLAASFDQVSGDTWRRTGNRSDGKHFTVESFARYMVHDPIHHVWDVEENVRMLG